MVKGGGIGDFGGFGGIGDFGELARASSGGGGAPSGLASAPDVPSRAEPRGAPRGGAGAELWRCSLKGRHFEREAL